MNILELELRVIFAGEHKKGSCLWLLVDFTVRECGAALWLCPYYKVVTIINSIGQGWMFFGGAVHTCKT